MSTPIVARFAALSASSSDLRKASSTFTEARTPETCTAGTSPKRFGAAYTRLTRTAIAISAYFQAGYLFMRLLRVLHRPLGQQRGDRLLLHLDGDVGRDLEREEVVADLLDLAEDSDRHDLVALLQRLDHGLVLLRLLHLRPDHDEVQHDE